MVNAAAACDDIRRLVSEGDEILVQVIKDPMGTKGARLTTYVSLPSNYLVYMPHGSGVGVSSRIEEEAERQRLKTLDRNRHARRARSRRLHRAHRRAGGLGRGTCARTWRICTSSGSTCARAVPQTAGRADRA